MTKEEFLTVKEGDEVFLAPDTKGHCKKAIVVEVYHDRFKDGAKVKFPVINPRSDLLEMGFRKRAELLKRPLTKEEIPIKRYAWQHPTTGEIFTPSQLEKKHPDLNHQKLADCLAMRKAVGGVIYNHVQLSMAHTVYAVCERGIGT